MDKELYKPFKSTAKNKKFSVYVMKDGKKGLRAKGIKNKKGELTWKNKNTSNYWSVHYLWNG